MPVYSEKNPEISQNLPPEGLLARILKRVEIERQALSLRQRFIIALIAFLVIVSAAFPVWRAFQEEFSRSGFGQYFSLLFSDFNVVLQNWQDYGMSLIESLPILSVLELLALLLAALSILKYLIKCSKGFFISYFFDN